MINTVVSNFGAPVFIDLLNLLQKRGKMLSKPSTHIRSSMYNIFVLSSIKILHLHFVMLMITYKY